MKVQSLVLPGSSVFAHLAAEHYLLETLDLSTGILLFYIDGAAVVWGKHQNPWYELPVHLLADSRVDLVRRSSGGGTVYHDPGNLNYSFLLPRAVFDQDRNLKIVAGALAGLGFKPVLSDRGDILLDGLKCSGNALWYLKDRVLHHGTLLVRADLHSLNQGMKGLKQDPDLRVEGHWVDSKPWPVMNLQDLAPQLVEDDVIASVIEALGPSHIGDAGHLLQGLSQKPRMVELERMYRSWEWNFARTGRFLCRASQPEPWCLEVEQGMIRAISLADGTESWEAPRNIPFFGAASVQLIRDNWESIGTRFLWEGLEALLPEWFGKEGNKNNL